MKNAVIGVVILLILIAGGMYLVKNNASQKQTTSDTPSAMAPKEENKNMFTSIKEAMDKSLSLKCDYAMADTQVTSYIKAGSVRSEVSAKGKTQISVMKDKKMYMWADGATVGYMLDLSKITPPPVAKTSPVAGQSSQVDYQKTMNTLEQYKDSCKPATVADSLFDVPANIKFTDMGAMMKGFGAGGAGVPSYNAADLEKMKQQYMPK